uniref:Nitrilase n=1 Tax=uncultured organism TaxID=155900 RepID=Q6RWE5_9ZZZZ|nr:nitrilase [uncultured organism]
MKQTRVAIIQAEPVYLNLQASVARAIDLAGRAAKQGARLIVFGETWLPGYPAWLDYCPGMAFWDHRPTKEVFARTRENSVVIPGKEIEQLCKTAAELGVVISIGVNEKILEGPGNGTLYNSLLLIDESGKLAGHHRKLVPTYTERMVWGMGDGGGMEAISTAAGRVGGLICWEHWMPLSRQVLHMSGEEIHVAVWPTVHEVHQLASRHYAFEGRCFVLAAGLLMKVRDIPPELELPSQMSRESEDWLLRGGSAVIGPDGKYIVEPLFDREAILTADLELAACDREKMTLDVTGHYSRPDLFHLEFRKQQSGHIAGAGTISRQKSAPDRADDH